MKTDLDVIVCWCVDLKKKSSLVVGLFCFFVVFFNLATCGCLVCHAKTLDAKERISTTPVSLLPTRRMDGLLRSVMELDQ